MIDLHTHILPHIDDGAKDLETSLAMLAMAEESGTKAIVATPHILEGKRLPAWADIIRRCKELTQTAKVKKLTLPILPGAEVMMTMDILDLIDGPGSYCINSSRYLLVELPSIEIPRFAEEFFFILRVRGIVPVLAHPERHPQIIRNPGYLREWLSQGGLIQMNSASITGKLGEKVQKTAELLLINNMVHAIASDAHGVHKRSPLLTSDVKKITAIVGYETMKRILVINPKKIIDNEKVEIKEVSGWKPARNNSFRSCIVKLFK